MVSGWCTRSRQCESCHTLEVNYRASARRAVLAVLVVLLGRGFVFGQGTRTTGTVAPNLVEFRIPLEQPAGARWNWNRAETSDNECEYMWQVAVPNRSGRTSFGFYLYKAPGSKPESGELQDLFKAGQASVFREDAQGHGDMVRNARVAVSEENGKIVLRITDTDLIQTIFGNHPDTATINTRAIGSNFELVKIRFLNQGAVTQASPK